MTGDEFRSLPWDDEGESVRAIQRLTYRLIDRIRVEMAGFPPPLTTIRGADGTIRVKHHREGGRLVLKAVTGHRF
ncbi:hypothetical protein Ccrd_011583 [Cynara cardunculus var. scolymus]|uniref:FAF domain-containing protein n=1 Tax=Cynara cardunculus var. scolymus TaxID=59895 RepID=A0A124SHM2_CYNCS|nr:hypothetical protein Ccrd_011583 [Cynara cardunculus var. scolymus]